MKTAPGERFDFTDLFIFEMANNHQGSVAHGKKIIRAMGNIARRHALKAAVKFQFRDLDTFIHPKHKKKSNNKHVSRFLSTRLSENDFKKLIREGRKEGLLIMATPFDEASVDMACRLGVDIIKVASSSALDFPLLERIAEAGKPVVISFGGVPLPRVDDVVTFFDHRYVNFAIQHCVSIYPTPVDALQLEQIAVFRRRFPSLVVGFSTHESPDNTENIQMAYAKGARIFEKHVGIPTSQAPLNAYSATPEQVEKWVEAWERARSALGTPERNIDQREIEDLAALQRGVFAAKSIKKGKIIKASDVYFSFPMEKEQLSSGRFVEGIKADKTYKKDEPIHAEARIELFSKKDAVYQAIHAVKGILNEAGVLITPEFEVELSHHYGMENFNKYGAVIIDCINREYCKKIIVQLPGQRHPNHHHKKKEEAFHMLFGELEMEIDGRRKTLRPGDVQVIQRGMKHCFWTTTGAVFEEISTTHHNDDSYYDDPRIRNMMREERKTKLINWGRHQFD